MVWQRLFGVGDLTPEKFAIFTAKVGVESGVFEAPEIDHDEFRIVEDSRTLNLHNIYQAFLRTPRKLRKDYVRNAITVPDDLPETWEEVAPMLVPSIRGPAYLTLMPLELRNMAQDAEPEVDMTLASKEIAPGVFATLAIDTPHVMALAQERQLSDWGVDFDTALDMALTNLSRMNPTEEFTAICPGLWIDGWHDSYSASRLLMPHLLQQVCSDPIVCAPNRDTLLICDGSADALAALVIVLEKMAEDESYAITRQVYQLSGKTLTPFELPTDNPAARAYAVLRFSADAEAYDRERELLDQQSDEDIFRATLMGRENEAGEVTTFATWTQTVPTLLPHADRVSLLMMDDDDPSVGGLWDVPLGVLDAAGLLTRNDSPLPRYRVGEFPERAWLEANGEYLGNPAMDDDPSVN